MGRFQIDCHQLRVLPLVLEYTAELSRAQIATAPNKTFFRYFGIQIN